MEEKNTEKEKTKYWQKQSFKHLSAMRAAKEAGLLPKKEGWRNVVEHELVESEACDVLAEALWLNKQERTNVTEAAAVHDVFKRKEIELMKKLGPDGYDLGQEEEAAFLKERSYSDEIIRLAQSVGHTSLLPMVKDPNAAELELKDDIDLATLIIHYVDDITLNNDLVPLNQRIDYLNGNPKYREINEQGKAVFGGRLYFEVQREVSSQIEERFASILGVVPATKLPEWIKSKIELRVENTGNKRLINPQT